MTILTLILVSLLCLVFKSTRSIGVAGLAVLFLLQPILFIAILFLTRGVAFYLYRKLNN